MATKRLYRSRTDRMIWGVCGGLAQYFDIDPTIVRVIAILSIFVGWGILAYIIMAIVVPLEGTTTTEPRDTIRQNVQEIKDTATQIGSDIQSTFKQTGEKPGATPSTNVPPVTPSEARSRDHGRTILGIILIVLGVIFLLGTFSWFWRFPWGFLWPIILIIIGLLILFATRRR